MATEMTTGNKVARLDLPSGPIELPIVVGTENETGVDISNLRSETGCITLDSGFGNTGSCKSTITYIDGEKGILRYRGYPIEQLAEHSTFIETSMLLINGELPTEDEYIKFRNLLRAHEMLHEGLYRHYDGFPASAHPMAILSAMINAMSCYHPDVMEMEDESTFESAAARLLSKVRTIAAAAYKTSVGQPIIYPMPNYKYVPNFLHMMFSVPNNNIEVDQEIVDALRLFLILHADHEQNCSTSTVRMVASSGANLFASCSAGVCALWGPLHGGANMAAIKMLQYILENDIPLDQYIERVKTRELKLMGFGHRVYKSYDPRARILQDAAEKLLNKLQIDDPLLDLARKLEEVALSDSFFKDRNLYPNVDFYSGIILRALGIPLNMYTVMFAIGRMPGWIAHWKEQVDSGGRIFRPRQIYTGSNAREYVAREKR